LMPGSHCRNEVGQDNGAQRLPSPDRRGGNAGECDLLTIAPHPKSTHFWLRCLVPSVKTGVPLNVFELDPKLRCRVHIYKRQDEHQHQQPTTALLLPPLTLTKPTLLMSSPIPGTGICCVTDRIWSLRTFYQLTDNHVEQSKHLDGVWTNQQLDFSPVDASPLASITYNKGKEVNKPLDVAGA
jgi:hypothetical protein